MFVETLPFSRSLNIPRPFAGKYDNVVRNPFLFIIGYAIIGSFSGCLRGLGKRSSPDYDKQNSHRRSFVSHQTSSYPP